MSVTLVLAGNYPAIFKQENIQDNETQAEWHTDICIWVTRLLLSSNTKCILIFSADSVLVPAQLQYLCAEWPDCALRALAEQNRMTTAAAGESYMCLHVPPLHTFAKMLFRYMLFYHQTPVNIWRLWFCPHCVMCFCFFFSLIRFLLLCQ